MSGSITSCYDELKGLRVKYGTSTYDHAVRQINRERVNSDRGTKKAFTWAQIKRAYKRQRGICPICTKEMALDRSKIHGDHWDPNVSEANGLNANENCMAGHIRCNLAKSSRSPAELSKLRQLNPTLGEDD